MWWEKVGSEGERMRGMREEGRGRESERDEREGEKGLSIVQENKKSE